MEKRKKIQWKNTNPKFLLFDFWHKMIFIYLLGYELSVSLLALWWDFNSLRIGSVF